MTQLIPYLRFEGKAREAMAFYKDVLGGELAMQTIGESPMADKMPSMKDKIMHSTLSLKGNPILMGSDMAPQEGLKKGNEIVLSLNCASEQEIKKHFTMLSAGGKILAPLKTEFWGGTFGRLIDRYGFEWMLNYQKEPMKM